MCPKLADKTWKHIHVKSRPTWSRDSWRWIYATFFATSSSCHPTKCIYADWAVVGQMYRSPSQMYCAHKCTDAPSQMYCLYKCTDAPSRAKWITCSATLLTLQTCNEPNSTGVEQSLADYIIQAFFADEWSRDRLARFALHFIFLPPQNNYQILRSTFGAERRFLSFLISEWCQFVPPFTLWCIIWFWQ